MSAIPKTTSASSVILKNTAAAPLVYFDSVPVYGAMGGMIEIEVSARVLMPKTDGKVHAEMNCTGHLRCSPQAAVQLADALQKALTMLAAQQKDVAEQPANEFRVN